MSRTIRRKSLCADSWSKDQSYRFYSDLYQPFTKVPKKCRQPLNQRFRCKNKAILRRGLKQCNIDIVFVPFKRTADWECV